jgi:hypothetical protein
VLSVKKNQGTLFNDVSLVMENIESLVSKASKAAMKESGQYVRTSEKGHGRYEVRECYLCSDISLLSTAHQWEGYGGFRGDNL